MYLVLFFSAPYVFVDQERRSGGRLPIQTPLNLISRIVVGLSLLASLACGRRVEDSAGCDDFADGFAQLGLGPVVGQFRFVCSVGLGECRLVVAVGPCRLVGEKWLDRRCAF